MVTSWDTLEEGQIDENEFGNDWTAVVNEDGRECFTWHLCFWKHGFTFELW